jgi:acyl-CoA hydrolase
MTDQTAGHPSNEPIGRPTAYSRVTLSRIMTAVDVNLYGTVHGGVLMKFVDDVAGAAAARHSGGTAVFVAVDVAGHPRPVPPVLPEDLEDERRFREALIRREHRLARRAAIQKARAE